jgi:hypothetical protein
MWLKIWHWGHRLGFGVMGQPDLTWSKWNYPIGNSVDGRMRHTIHVKLMKIGTRKVSCQPVTDFSHPWADQTNEIAIKFDFHLFCKRYLFTSLMTFMWAIGLRSRSRNYNLPSHHSSKHNMKYDTWVSMDLSNARPLFGRVLYSKWKRQAGAGKSTWISCIHQ